MVSLSKYRRQGEVRTLRRRITDNLIDDLCEYRPDTDLSKYTVGKDL